MTERMRFLERLDDATRALLQQRLVIRGLARGEIIIGQNEADKDVYFVLDGRARVTVFSEEGKAVAFRDIESGDIFGEFAAIDGAPRSANVIATDDVEVGRIALADFRGLVEESPSFAWALLAHVTHQARSMTERIFEYSTMVVRDRLIAELLRLADAAGVVGGRAVLTPAPTHFDLANRISTHREAVSREMSRLAKLKLVSKSGGSLTLHDVERLAVAR